MKKICIVGAGIFGTTLALILSKKKNIRIDIYERNKDILNETSLKNQQRFHLGYHYPRSKITIKECLESFDSFKSNLGNTFLKSKNYYAISKNDSRINYENYIEVLNEMNLPFKKVSLDFFKKNTIQGAIEVEEKIINISKVRKFLKYLLAKKNINFFLNTHVNLNDSFLKSYDHVILTTYSENNENLKPFNLIKKKKIYYQLVEKIVIHPPKHLIKKSIVLMDGNFFCIDPYEERGLSILGSVKNSIIDKKNSVYAKNLLSNRYLESYLFINKKNSLFKKIKKDFCKVFKNFEKAKYYKSFYSVRSTYKNKNDDRVTQIIKYKNLSIVHAGKWINCFLTGKKIAKSL